MKSITVRSLVVLFVLCWISPLYASSLIPIYSLLLSPTSNAVNDYRYAEFCQVADNGTGITTALVEWNLVLTQPDGGDIYWIFNDTEYKSYHFLNNDFGAIFSDFAYSTIQDNASWQTYDYNSIRLLEPEYTSLVDSFMSYERTDDTSKNLRTNEVLNFYDKELWTQQEVKRIMHNHLQNNSCVRDEPEEKVGCEFMWEVQLSYTIVGFSDYPNDPYSYSGQVKFDYAVLAYDSFSAGIADMNQCWYPNAAGITNSDDFVTLDNSINSPDSKEFTEFCSGSGCPALSTTKTASIRIDIENSTIWVSPGVEGTIDLNSILVKTEFSKLLNNVPLSAADDVITVNLTFTPQPIHYSRPIIYCGYTDTSGECSVDNPAIVRVPDDF